MLNPESTFENICNELKGKIENWESFYSLVNKETEEEVSTLEAFDRIVKTAIENEKTNVAFVCKPKFTFIVTREVSKMDETDEEHNNNCSFRYYGDSKYHFEDFVTQIQKQFTNIQQKFNLSYNDTLIDDQVSFAGMITHIKRENKSKVFITLTIKVSFLFSCWLQFYCMAEKRLVLL